MQEPLVLCYHAVGVRWPASVEPGQLRRHVEILLRRGYEPVTFVRAVTEQASGKRFAVTFDDAHSSVLEDAYPVLAGLGVPATVFAVTSFACTGAPLDWAGLDESGLGRDEASRRSLGWAELRELAKSGWEVGSHTCTHPRLTELDDRALAHELRDSRTACERALGRPCRSIAYPYGAVDQRVAAAAAAAGYEAGCSLSVTTEGTFCWPRVGVYGIDSPVRFRVKVSPVTMWVRRALARAAA
ncbi:MAG TPA: polysaccharide deacetylase family protein [Gaiellaceae bacterium]|jgi:peptidoglycan/xylan/chitin deacetylase (PgdA/CDA1 family)|nr:polysaccharide deacetylase family protein [Gaiellaceae bacterium]